MASLFKSGMGGLLFIYLSVALLVIIIFGWLFCCVQYRINYIYRKQSFAPMKKTVKYRRQPKTSIMESNFKQTVPSRKKLQKMEPSMMPLLASPEKISNQILKQVSEALKLLQIIKASLPQTLSSKRIASNPVLEEYRAIQQQLREKQRSITCLEGDIKELKISMVTGWAKEMRGSFGHEIKSMREGLMHVVEEYRGKMGKLDREREKVRKLENQYVIQCLRTGAQVVSYDTFLEHYMNKVQPFTISTTSNIKSQNRLRDKSKKHLQEKDHNKMSTHKKIPSPSPGLGTKKMQDLLTHRDVISSALRAAKKKHHNETNQYRSKLQFLKDQYRSLEEKVVSKIKELRVAQEKFKERRAKEKGKSKSKRKSESKSQSKRSLRTQRTERTERLITMCTQER